MGNWEKNYFFNKLATTTSLALLLCSRGLCECLATSNRLTGYRVSRMIVFRDRYFRVFGWWYKFSMGN